MQCRKYGIIAFVGLIERSRSEFSTKHGFPNSVYNFLHQTSYIYLFVIRTQFRNYLSVFCFFYCNISYCKYYIIFKVKYCIYYIIIIILLLLLYHHHYIIIIILLKCAPVEAIARKIRQDSMTEQN